MRPPTTPAIPVAAVLLTAAAFLSPIQALDNRTPRLKTDHFVFYAPPAVADADVVAFSGRAEATFEKATRFLEGAAGLPPIDCVLFQTLEDKGLATGYTLPAHALSGTGELFAALEPGFEGEADLALAVLIVQRVLGRSRVELLETGLAMGFVEGWRGGGYRYWAARIGRLEGAADLEGLLDNKRYRAGSRLVARPLAGAFVDYALDVFGKEAFLKGYSSWEPTANEIASIEPGWREYLDKLEEPPAGVAAAEVGGIALLPAFHKGFCHAHEGYQVHNGYISRRSDAALEKLCSLGANAVSVTPFTYMRNPKSATPFAYSRQTGAENDESVIHATLAAKRLGMAVMLKPHVWIHDSWPGEVEMETDGEWDRFFEFYWSWIRHYAVMAEMYDIEALCVGVELSRTTVGHEARWVELFESVRAVYGGKLVYAANWGDEFENVSFWDALDYIGVNCYYPLSDDRSPTDEQLRAGVERALSRIDVVAQRFGKPVIITEVGFTSSPTPWIEPYEREWRSAVDERAQARCYQAFIDSMAGRPGYAGVYWWKWPSFLEYGGPRHSGFTPNGKIAEEIVKQWFGATSID
jgi:sugar phosphate isomerase/epimerase